MPCIAKPKANPQLTTAQLLGSVIRSARDIMRKDKGLNGDADRLPMLTWVLFLKFLDDLEAQCRTVEDRRVLQTRSIAGGEEEPGIQNNFPQDKRTAETALLFLQLIMRKLRKLPPPLRERAGVRGQADCDAQSKEARAAVVPNGALFGDGVAARVKEALLTEFNLHTVVRLPNGVFAPYTSIPTSLIFFDRAGPTREIWYYELPPPEGRKQYTKTAPIQFEEFAACLAWWQVREENARAWKVRAEDVLKYDTDSALLSANLDATNPKSKSDFEHLPPAQLADDILKKELRIAELMREILADLESNTEVDSKSAATSGDTHG